MWTFIFCLFLGITIDNWHAPIFFYPLEKYCAETAGYLSKFRTFLGFIEKIVATLLKLTESHTELFLGRYPTYSPSESVAEFKNYAVASGIPSKPNPIQSLVPLDLPFLLDVVIEAIERNQGFIFDQFIHKKNRVSNVQ